MIKKVIDKQAEDFVTFGLNEDNVAKALVFAHENGIKDMKRNAIEFIKSDKFMNKDSLKTIPAELLIAII